MKKAMLVVIVLVFVVSGCASMDTRQQCITKYAVAGAAIGAGSGAIIGNQADNDNKEEGSMIGAAAGGIVGGVVGYIVCKGDLDADGDGVLDCDDRCPGTPSGVAVDRDGCPLDSDKDGVPDYKDKCPGTPMGVTVDSSGCPLDSDGDGVIDGKDKCPDTPRGVQVDKAGCPLDSDGDGVADYLDKCPGTPRGSIVDTRGCPLAGEKMAVLHINFAFDKADISPEAAAVLDANVAVLKKNSDIRVRIVGHTDSTGPAEYNMGLSKRRAHAVMDYLVAKGISSDRLEAEGKGETEPMVSNDTREGRSQNRRVVFIVID